MSRSPSPLPPPLPPVPPMHGLGPQLKEIDDPLPEVIDMSLGEWYELWLRLHEQGRSEDRDVFALTGHFVDPATGEPRRARLDATRHVLPPRYVISQYCDIDSIIGAPLQRIPLAENATLKYFPLLSPAHTLVSSMHIPPISYTQGDGTDGRAHLHKIANARFAEVGQVLIRIFFPRIDKGHCSNNVPNNSFMSLLYDLAVMPMALRHVPEEQRVGWPAKYPNESWRAGNYAVSEEGEELATGARQQTAREVHGRDVHAWIEGIRSAVDNTPALAGARGFFFGFELRGAKKIEGSIHSPPEECLVDQQGRLVYEEIERTRVLRNLLTGFDMAAIHRDMENWFVDVATNVTVACRPNERAGSAFAFDLMHPYILNWATNAELEQCQAWVDGEGRCFARDEAAHLGSMAGFRFTNPAGEETGIHYTQLYYSYKSIAYNLSLQKKIKQSSALRVVEDWDKERKGFFLPLLQVIKDSAGTHGVVFRLESRVSWFNYVQVHLAIPDEVVRPWLLYVHNGIFWGWMYARLMSIVNVLSQWMAVRTQFVKPALPETVSLLVLLCWMANALLKRPDEGSHWDEVCDAGSVHAIEGGRITPSRPLTQYYLHSLHLVQNQLPRISSLRTVSIEALLYLFSRREEPMDHLRLHALIVGGNPPASARKAPTSDPWGGDDEENGRPVVRQQRTNNRQPIVHAVSSEETPDQFVGMIAEPAGPRYPSEERDYEQRQLPPTYGQLLTNLVHDYPIQIFKKAPNRRDASWCDLAPEEIDAVTFNVFRSIEQLHRAFPSHISFGMNSGMWKSVVAILFPTLEESQVHRQNVSKLGAYRRYIDLLQSLPPDQQEGVVEYARDYVDRRWRWLPHGKGRLWATGTAGVSKYASRVGPIGGGPWIVMNTRTQYDD